MLHKLLIPFNFKLRHQLVATVIRPEIPEVFENQLTFVAGENQPEQGNSYGIDKKDNTVVYRLEMHIIGKDKDKDKCKVLVPSIELLIGWLVV